MHRLSAMYHPYWTNRNEFWALLTKSTRFYVTCWGGVKPYTNWHGLPWNHAISRTSRSEHLNIEMDLFWAWQSMDTCLAGRKLDHGFSMAPQRVKNLLPIKLVKLMPHQLAKTFRNGLSRLQKTRNIYQMDKIHQDFQPAKIHQNPKHLLPSDNST